jgi:hypothetical protein
MRRIYSIVGVASLENRTEGTHKFRVIIVADGESSVEVVDECLSCLMPGCGDQNHRWVVSKPNIKDLWDLGAPEVQLRTMGQHHR